MTLLDRIVLLATGLVAVYLLYNFYGRYSKKKALYDLYYMLGFAVLFVSGVLLIIRGYEILGTPFVLTVASLIPLGVSLGIANQFYPGWKKLFAWFALIGFLAIAYTTIAESDLKRMAVPLFHGVAGFVIFLGPIFAEKNGKAPKGFFWVGIGGALIGIGGMALAFISAGKPLPLFSEDFVMTILAPLLFLMVLAFAMGFNKDLKGS